GWNHKGREGYKGSSVDVDSYNFAPLRGQCHQSEKHVPATKHSAGRKSQTRWVARVTTDSTHPPQGLFTKDAATIARSLASKKVSPKGPGSGMRMLTYFINRGGRGLSTTRRAELERAKKLLSERARRARERS